MDLTEKRNFISSKLDFAEYLGALLSEHGEQVPSVFGKESNKSVRLRQLIGPDRKLNLSKDSDGMRQLLNHKDKRIQKIARAKLAVQSWPLHIRRVENLISFANARNGRIGIPVKYCGALTHRNSGTDGVNFYNIPARPKKGYELIKDIKTLVRAPKGYVLLTFDYSQIEARYLAYIAGQTDLVESFRAKRDVYSEAATTVFGKKTREPIPSDPPPVAKQLTIRRNFGKMEILGAGYGMGATTFYNRCYEDDRLRAAITPQLAESIIKTYRKTYSAIPKFWKTVENLFKFVVKYPEEKMTKHGLVVEHDQKYNRIFLTLPSGSRLYYPQVVKCQSSNNLKWLYSRGASFWGGPISENIVQSASRDILVDAMLSVKQAGYNIAADLYDSFTVLVKKESAKEAEEELTVIACKPPEWCATVPLAIKMEVSETL